MRNILELSGLFIYRGELLSFLLPEGHKKLLGYFLLEGSVPKVTLLIGAQ